MTKPRIPQLARLILAVALATVYALNASPAGAHAALKSASPGQGSRVEVLPEQVELVFDGPMSQPTEVTVLAPDGNEINVGQAAVDAETVTQKVSDPGQAGLYLVTFETTSEDAHPVSGSYKFRVTSGTPTESDATSNPSKSEQEFTWFFVGFGVLAAIVIVLWLVGRLRRDES